uniref:Uncharacterized protein n=1 Tax=Alocasia macrorrhizos TaxID=4456 RepID=A0A0U2CIM5_ALOMA|nr:hypothetical protein ycf68 [Alocasia macrorrhizos]
MAYSSCSNRSLKPSGEIQWRSNFLFTRGIRAVRGGDPHGSSLLENPYTPYQCMDSYLSSTGSGSASMGKWSTLQRIFTDQELRDRPFHSGVTEGSYHSSLFFMPEV